MSTVAVIAGAKVAVETGKQVAKATKEVIKAGRKAIAREEMYEGKDIDGNGRIGSVGRRPKRLQRRAGGSTRT